MIILAQYFTLCELMTAVIDSIPKHQQTSDMLKIKRLMLHQIAGIHKMIKKTSEKVALDSDKTELAYFEMGKWIEVFTKVIQEKDPQITMALLQAYLAGEIAALDSGKHQKILRQAKTI